MYKARKESLRKNVNVQKLDFDKSFNGSFYIDNCVALYIKVPVAMVNRV